MVRARKAHVRADALHRKLGWGERELRVRLPGDQVRVLDIGDRQSSRGVEDKRGYISLDPNTARQLYMDAWLVENQEWSITWHVDGRCSQPLRDALRAANIKLIELRADTPTKEL